MNYGSGLSNTCLRGVVTLLLGTVLSTFAMVTKAEFGVQVGAFANRSNAERVLTRLGVAGFTNVRLWIIGRPTQTLTTVLVGPYSRREQARQVQAALVAIGLRCIISTYPVALLVQPYSPRTEPESAPAIRQPAPPTKSVSKPATSTVKDTRLEWSGYVASEYRSFFNSPVDPRQRDDNFSVALEPELYYEWNSGNDSFTFVPFFRLDQHDNERTHFDIRELTWLTARDGWEIRAGVRKVFWGVTESLHLVDVINQTDLVENIDTEDKLGQLMVNYALIRDWGTLDLFILPYFRERTFPGSEGRLRMSPRVDTDDAIYESSRDKKHIDLAGRWSHTKGDWDWGVSHFAGTSRDPRFTPGARAGGEMVMIPVYDQIDQTGLDVQATKGPWLWKMEAIRRSGQGAIFFAGVAGFEYTFFSAFDTALDVGLVTEYLYDDRPKEVEPPFADDLFAGIRLALNDVQSTQALVGCIFDLSTSARACNLEANRRLGDRWVFELEVRSFQEIPEDDPLFTLRRDDYAQLQLSYHF